ncbi:hypothetical protein NHP190012_16260 (plasmid) [Helicobacter sp. NHP19-012]|uniref:Type I restriction modification DNA specificity domain-containing protein n=1 Tax=Helicobacter gastrofelis TaxID=2849642 RepID=A0ABN6IB39_9HELI|nr:MULTISPECIES: restriction endonuclease subunit S [unclassified Helicobacter]BCZ19984.1 hypothetical protein NHP190012_16260 [Helicobacter sp. NHP19-012]GMB96751.1 hypothetical protein NHP22001_13400 [Helicobacter sp. NHP22-001]
MEGLENLPAGWEVVELGKIGTFARGSGLVKADLQAEGVGAIHYGQIHTYYNTHTAQTKSFVSSKLAKTLKRAGRGDLIITGVSEDIEGVLKAVAYLGEADICISGDIFAFSHKQDPIFIAYVFQSAYFMRLKAKYASGVKVLRVKLENLRNFQIPLPPLAEQHAIAAFLDEKISKLDALIAKKTQLLEHLKDYKHALISEVATKGLDPNARMKPSGLDWLGEVPEGWEVVRLDSLFGTRNETNRDKAITQILSLVKDMGVLPYEQKGNIGNKAKKDISQYRIVRRGDLVFNKMNAVIGSLGFSQYEGLVSPIYLVLFAKDKRLTFIKYYAYLFGNKALQSSLSQYATGIMKIRESIDYTIFKGMPLPLPPLAEQHTITAFLDKKTRQLECLSAKLQTQIQALKDYKSALISEAVLGLIPLKDTHEKIHRRRP